MFPFQIDFFIQKQDVMLKLIKPEKRGNRDINKKTKSTSFKAKWAQMQGFIWILLFSVRRP